MYYMWACKVPCVLPSTALRDIETPGTNEIVEIQNPGTKIHCECHEKETDCGVTRPGIPEKEMVLNEICEKAPKKVDRVRIICECNRTIRNACLDMRRADKFWPGKKLLQGGLHTESLPFPYDGKF